MKVSLGILSYNRPTYLEKCAKAVIKQCSGVVDSLYCLNDGSSTKHRASYQRAFKPLVAAGATIFDEPVNRGPAFGKNKLLEAMLDNGADWCILVEDDIIVKSHLAVTEYVRIAKETGIHHLAFGLHGPANLSGPVKTEGDVVFYPHSVGAYTIFSAECLRAVGLMDETFVRAWEHVCHDLMLIKAGFMPGAAAYCYPDVARSGEYLAEIPNSIDNSSIRPLPDWSQNIHDGLRHFKNAHMDEYNMLFGPDKPLHTYAKGILGE